MDNIAALRKELLTLSEGDAEAFSERTNAFFRTCHVPVVPVSDEEGICNVKSYINGVAMYAIKETTFSEYDALQNKARAASVLWNRFPLAARQEFFRILAAEVGPKYRDMIDLAITLEVGKAGSEFAKMAQWDGWAASQDVSNYLVSDIYMTDANGRHYDLSNASDIPDDVKPIYIYEEGAGQGLGISGGSCGFNYPAALAIPDVVCSRLTGNSFIGKVPSKAPSFMFIRKHAEHAALDVMAERFDTYAWADKARSRGVDMADAKILQTLKDGFVIISGREMTGQWSSDCETFRIVGGASAGRFYRRHRAHKDPRGERTILELAGNNPVVMMPSTVNIDGGLKAAIYANAEGNKGNSGQRCTSPRRWMIHEDIYVEAKALAIAEYSASANNADGNIGNPLDAATKIGAMDKGGFTQAQGYLKAAKAAGAEVIGGEHVLADRFPEAYYMAPALVIWGGVSDAQKQMMHDHEIFAPIANLDTISSVEDAVAKTNMSNEHLSGGFYCDAEHIDELAHYAANTYLGSLIHNGPPKDQSPVGVHAGTQDGGQGITGSLKSLNQYMSRGAGDSVRLVSVVNSRDEAIGFAKKLREQVA